MLYLSFALYAEAKPFIHEFCLKAENGYAGFQVFSGDNIRLIINGAGNLTSAIHLTAFLSAEHISPDDFFINIGSAASKVRHISTFPENGHADKVPEDKLADTSPESNRSNVKDCYIPCTEQPVFLCNKIRELSTGRTFYPDLLHAHNFTEAACITSPVPLHSAACRGLFQSPDTPVVVDMEASSCYQAAARHFKTHRMFFLKYISDSGIPADTARKINVTPDSGTIEKILEFLRMLSEHPSDGGGKARQYKENAARAAGLLAPLFSCSVTMKHELEKLFVYYECGGNSSEKTAQAFKDRYRDELPVPKKQGKLYFDRLKTEILNADRIPASAGHLNADCIPNNTGHLYADCVPNNAERLHDDPGQVNTAVSCTAPLLPRFSHIYVERQTAKHPLTQKILAKFSHASVIFIDHYKDIFNRHGQDFSMQKRSPALILAYNKGERIYPGARTCQDFGHEHFYYTSQIKNCIYDCEYCYLQGMYPSGYINLFVNTEDYFEDVDTLLQSHPVSLSISYDTDLLALDGITGLVKKWCEFAAKRSGLTLEIRTKCGSLKAFEGYPLPSNVVLAYTISPASVAEHFEHGASGYEMRKQALYASLEKGCTTRLSLDPVLPVADFEKIYTETIQDIFSNPLTKKITDVSIGSFRISREYISKMREVRLNRITAYPYTIKDGICTFDETMHSHMMQTLKNALLKYVPEDKIFVSQENPSS